MKCNNMDVVITTVATDDEIRQIKELQTKNLRRVIPVEEAESQGYLTAEYEIEYLTELNRKNPGVIAKVGDVVVGYNLVADREIASKHVLLGGLFDSIQQLEYDGHHLKDRNIVICGQLCVEKAYRGMGLVDRMYQHFKDCYRSKYDYCMTDVAEENPRSVKAHERVGFRTISENVHFGKTFVIIMWDWHI